ncbi:MAG: TPM domain-containing protein, partial [Thiobacillaceae bacterium]
MRRATARAGWLGLLLLSWLALAELAIPRLTARVTDLTATLSEAQRDALEQRLAAFEREKGSQLAVLIVPSTRPESIEQYAIRVAEAWKLGRKGVDDGILLLVAKDDRAVRLEVGYGLEGVIPDAIAKRIIAEVIVPRFRTGDYYGGIDAGVEALIGRIEGEALPLPAKRAQTHPGVNLLENALPLAMMFVFVVGGLLRALLGRLLGASVAGAVAFIGAW